MESQNSSIGPETHHLKTIRRTFARVLEADFSLSRAAPGKIESALNTFGPIYDRMRYDTAKQPTATEVNTVTAHLSMAFSYAVGRVPGAYEILNPCITALAEYKWFIEAKSKK